MRRAVVVTGRLVVLLYELAVAGTVTALAAAAWKDDLYTTAVGGYLLALALTILGLVTVVRPMRAGFLQLTFNLGIGGFCLFSLIRRDFRLPLGASGAWSFLIALYGRRAATNLALAHPRPRHP